MSLEQNIRLESAKITSVDVFSVINVNSFKNYCNFSTLAKMS